MEFQQAVEELQHNLEQIEKLCRLKRLRRILKFLLIGFLIWRDSDRKISELVEKNKLIIDDVLHRTKGVEDVSQQIREFADASTRLTAIEDGMKELASLKDLVADIEDWVRKRREIIAEFVWKAVEQRGQDMVARVEEIENSGTYLIYSEKQRHLDAIRSFEEDLDFCGQNKILLDEYLTDKKKNLVKYLQAISDYNGEFVQKRREKYRHLWYKGLLCLDDEQQTAIVTDDKHNLVVAAAGSGKTEILITRIAYLIARKPDDVQPNRILAIAYQRKAREEIERRLRDRYNIRDVKVRTFHKLGKDILEEEDRKFLHTDIVDENRKHDAVRRIFKEKIEKDPYYFELFLKFVKTLYDKERKEDAKTKEEALAYARERPYHAINYTRVNSRAEKEIMDFFLTVKLNGKAVAIKYEPDFEGFRPDFYLPDYDLYIEHWALNENGEVPEWFSQTTEEYKESMEMKKKVFSERGKLLVETFSHEYNEKDPNRFIELLTNRVIEKLQTRHEDKFRFTYKTYDEIINIAWQSYRTPIDDIVNFITTAKTYDLAPARIAEKLQSDQWSRKQVAFGNLALPVYSAYEEALEERGKIDFEDMINHAINKLDSEADLRADVYDHILIDEYQDISAQRCRLIKKLMDRNPKCKLFCVGDDWQSIMGFSGSNLNFFVNFKEYFENPAVTSISTNYRSVKTIVDAGADLIKNNTSCQIQKPTTSNRKDVKPIKVLKSPHQEDYERNYHYQTAEDCLNRIADLVQNGYSPRDILVLSRCMRTRVRGGYRYISNVKTFIDEAKESGVDLVYNNAEARNKIRLLTAHKSKGLEAKVVFLLNVTKGTYGFPCEIEDPSIYEIARENYPQQDPKEEERRLFYVAMTRAKEDLYIYTWEPSMSEFLEEIADHTVEERLVY